MATPQNGSIVLCVDDEAVGLSVRKMTLESQGYRVLTAESGPAALTLFSAENIELVILDFMMPGMNGDVVAERMKRLLDQRLDGDTKTRQLISIAQNEVQRVTEISRNMLSLHRESRSASVVRLASLLEGVVALVEETIAKGRRRIELVHGFAGDIEAFPVGLRQVFTNVIKNAIEATPEDGEISIQSESASEGGQEGVVVRVSDNGPGIPEEFRSRLFNQPFVSTKEEGGTGLGLWVSASIITKHGGSIRLESAGARRGHGATVSIFLPLRVAQEAGAAPAPTEAAD